MLWLNSGDRMVKIERAFNGWIVKHDVEDEGEHVYVYDEGETDEDAANAFSSVLYRIKSILGPHESRYSAHRVMIRVEPGDKHSSHPDNQES